MLKIVESTTLSGYSIIDGLQVISMMGSVTEDETVYPMISATILSKEGFNSNFEQCKADVNEFVLEALTRQYTLLSANGEEE